MCIYREPLVYSSDRMAICTRGERGVFTNFHLLTAYAIDSTIIIARRMRMSAAVYSLLCVCLCVCYLQGALKFCTSI
jgi:hypothetical protein